jgi:hypothetical protein
MGKRSDRNRSVSDCSVEGQSSRVLRLSLYRALYKYIMSTASLAPLWRFPAQQRDPGPGYNRSEFSPELNRDISSNYSRGITVKLARYFLMLVLLAACSNTATPSGPAAVSTVDVANSPCRGVRNPAGLNLAPGGSKKWSAPEQVIDTSHTYCAVLTTQKGTIVAELYPKGGP